MTNRVPIEAHLNERKNHMRRIFIVRWASIVALVVPGAAAWAHAPVLDCYIEQDKVHCEAGFSDGSSAAGRNIQVLDAKNKVLLEGKLDKTGVYEFKPPLGEYHVIFVGGDHHEVTLYSSNFSK